MSPSNAATQQNAKLMEMRTRLLYAACSSYAKNPTDAKLDEVNRVMKMASQIIGDEVADINGSKWSSKLVGQF